MKSIIKKINILRKKIRYHSYLYHTLNQPIITDTQYDVLIQKLIQLETQHPKLITTDSPTKRVGSKILKKFDIVHHMVPMQSLENVFDKNNYLKFKNRIEKKLELKNRKELFCCELKLDGLAVNLIYKDGILVTASTRGNGLYGENVTKNIRTIKTIPYRLYGNNIPEVVEIRGEVFMSKQGFFLLNKKAHQFGTRIFSNPRNAAAGSLRHLNPHITATRPLNFFCYGHGLIKGVNIPNSHWKRLQLFKSWGIPINDKNITLCSNDQEVFLFYQKMYHARKKLNFDIDGIVIKVDNTVLQKKLGTSNFAPKWAVAFKFPAQEAISIIQDVKFQIGRTGVITPIACLQPVYISGVQVKYATLHNVREIERLNLHIGDQVIVRRAGDVIPKIISVVQPKNSVKKNKIFFPKKCPECNSDIKFIKSKILKKCTGEFICPGQKKEKLKHFVSRDALNVQGLGKNLISALVEKKYIKNFSDLFYLTSSELTKKNFLGITQSEKILYAIKKSKKTTFASFLYSLGIPSVGKKTAENIANYFLTIEKFMSADCNQFLQISGISKNISIKIKTFVQNSENKKLIDELINKVGIFW